MQNTLQNIIFHYLNFRIHFTSKLVEIVDSKKKTKIMKIYKIKEFSGNNQKLESWKRLQTNAQIHKIKRRRLIGQRNPRQCEEKYRRLKAYKDIKDETSTKDFWTKEEESILYDLVENYGFKWKLFEQQFKNRSWIQIKQKYYNEIRRRQKVERLRETLNQIKICENQEDINFAEQLMELKNQLQQNQTQGINNDNRYQI